MTDQLLSQTGTPEHRAGAPWISSQVGVAPADRGFTLVELMMVIAIIAVISMAVLVRARNYSNEGAAIRRTTRFVQWRRGCYQRCELLRGRRLAAGARLALFRNQPGRDDVHRV